MLTVLKHLLDLAVTESCWTLTNRSFLANFTCYRLYTRTSASQKIKQVCTDLTASKRYRKNQIPEIRTRHPKTRDKIVQPSLLTRPYKFLTSQMMAKRLHSGESISTLLRVTLE
jgi:hypothetical protein